jgi:hypothetical protein
MAEIRDISKIREKWQRVTPLRAEDYKRGVAEPKRNWEEAAKAAADVWKTAITEAANRGAFAKGVAEAGLSKWQQKAQAKGPSRYSEGVMIAAPDYERGFAPFAEVIRATTLPARFPKGDPRNIERVKTIATALRQKKTGTTSK